MEKLIFTIPEINLFRLNQKIEQMNRKAIKLTLPQVSTIVHKSYIQTWKDEFGRKHLMPYVELELIGQRPQIPGWTFCGTLEHTDAGNILRSMPGSEIPESFRNVKAVCDHCRLQRDRKDTFVVLHESGDYKQVGRRCIRDFLGGVTPEQLGWWAEIIATFGDAGNPDEGGSTHPKFTVSIQTYIQTVAELSLRYGFVSRQAAEHGGQSTAQLAWLFFTARGEERRKLPELETTDAGLKLAANALTWIQTIDPQSSNQFMHNLYIMSQKDRLTHRDCGLSAYIIESYRKEILKIEAKRKVANEQYEAGKNSEHVGEIKKRSVFTLTLDKIVALPGYAGMPDQNRFLYSFTDDKGNKIVWFASKAADAFSPVKLEVGSYLGRVQLKVGQTYTGKATPKAHSIYNGVKQTIVTRCDLALVEQNTEGKAS